MTDLGPIERLVEIAPLLGGVLKSEVGEARAALNGVKIELDALRFALNQLKSELAELRSY